MTTIADEIVKLAFQEWEYFGRSSRSIDDEWHLGGNESDDPFRTHISLYWAAVGQPDWDGDTPKAWSAAFISWCFKKAGAGDDFRASGSHARYMNRIRLHDEMSPRLRLRPPSRAVAPGDLIWNSRGDASPTSFDSAIECFKAEKTYFDSHVDIVVAVRPGECDSIGGNVYPASPGGSVVRSTWRLDGAGCLSDARKIWLGVVKNGL